MTRWRTHFFTSEYCRVFGFGANHKFRSTRIAIEELFKRSIDNSINIRSYIPTDPRSKEFVYGLTNLDDALGALSRLCSDGLFTIANETINVNDGGVSGVAMGDVVEFSPDDTPRAVEKSGVASLSRHLALELLATVYRFTPEINLPWPSRLEFSIHPKRRGWRHAHTIAWEYEPISVTEVRPHLAWPNNFSRMLGDKTFGLLVAHHLGLPTPRTTVISRRVAPFTFGIDTGGSEIWTRTSPVEQVPGKFTTAEGWIDPFKLLAEEDPHSVEIASVLCQDSIVGLFSGAAITDANLNLVVEGISGSGLPFMQGLTPPQRLPKKITDDVLAISEAAWRALGPTRFEWVHDGERAWVVQIHKGATTTRGHEIVSGEASTWIEFDSREGLQSLRKLIATLPKGYGIEVTGNVGVTSHIADVIRKAKVPARIPSLPPAFRAKRAS